MKWARVLGPYEVRREGKKDVPGGAVERYSFHNDDEFLSLISHISISQKIVGETETQEITAFAPGDASARERER